MPGFPGHDRLEFFSEAVAAFADDRQYVFSEGLQSWEAVRDGHPVPEGAVRPLTWLLQQVARRCGCFPNPLKMREIYEERYTPMDGRAAYQMLDEV